MTRLIAILAVAVLVQTSAAPSPADHPRGYVAHRIATPLIVDGRLDEAAWSSAAWTDTFVDIEGDKKPRPRFDTRVKMMWDASYFYIGADMREPHLWGTLTEHDSVIFRDNDFELFIDPDGDNHEYYELEINALGTTWDLLLPKPYKDDGKAVNGWEIAGLKSAIHLDGTLNNPRDEDRAWSVELALPWAALGELARRPSPPGDGDQWRVNFSRVEWQTRQDQGQPSGYRKVPDTNENNWVWSPQHVINMHRPERWGYVQFSTAAPGTVAFRPDSTWPARLWLHEVYDAQVAFRKAKGRYAATLLELGVASPKPPMTDPVMTVGGAQFEASVVSAATRWAIQQDSRILRR